MKRVVLIVLLSIATLLAADKSRFEPGPASSYPGHQTLDKITIAAVPYDDEQLSATAFGKAYPYKYGILPVLVVLQNDTGKALRLNLTAEFIDARNQHLDAMSPADVVLFDGSRKANWKVPGPPLPFPHKSKHGPLHTPEIEGLAFNAKLVPPGDSVHGFFYFETPNEPGSRLYLNGIKDAATGKDYFYFEVPFANQ